jgi:hypothetical protein
MKSLERPKVIHSVPAIYTNTINNKYIRREKGNWSYRGNSLDYLSSSR